MLKKVRIRLSLVTMVTMVALLVGSQVGLVSHADTCSSSVHWMGHSDTVTVSTTCEDQSGSEESDGSSDDSGPVGCFTWDGTEVSCWEGDKWWHSGFNMYCELLTDPISLDQFGVKNQAGEYAGTFYRCNVPGNPGLEMTMWENDRSSTPGRTGSDPKTVVKSAIANLGLHPPVPGVGAYVYPGYYQWGLTWWVGAPMWLWVDTTDDLQWGTHTITATEGGLTITATVTAGKAVFDPGDGGDPVTCNNAGTFRGWDPNDRLSHHSPSGCEYTYLETNKMEDMNSRFEVSATVVWDVEWSTTDGQYGTFTVETHSETTASIHVGELHVRQVPNPVPSPR